MTTLLFIGNMIFCFVAMYFYGKIRYTDGFNEGLSVNIERVEKQKIDVS